jgi:hypothetical protein
LLLFGLIGPQALSTGSVAVGSGFRMIAPRASRRSGMVGVDGDADAEGDAECPAVDDGELGAVVAGCVVSGGSVGFGKSGDAVGVALGVAVGVAFRVAAGVGAGSLARSASELARCSGVLKAARKALSTMGR